MSEDIETAPLPTPDDPPARARVRSGSGAPRGSGVAWLIALLALAVGGLALWRVVALERGQANTQTALRDELGARFDVLSHNAERGKRDLDGLRARVADTDSVNQSVREEILGLGERSRHLEDAVANLAEQRLSGRDALALNEAEFLLQQAAERLVLFHDAQAAIAAYQLADSALAAAQDPVFASVRQSIGAERRALEASRPVDTQGAITTLERLRASLATLPVPHASVVDDSASSSRWARFFAQFVHISHRSDVDPVAGRDIGLRRTLGAIDLHAAEAALLARDADGYKAALARTRAGIAAGFDGQSAEVAKALAELDGLASAPLAPALPELGNALKELRNLRATRALAQPSAVLPAAAQPAANAATLAPAPTEVRP